MNVTDEMIDACIKANTNAKLFENGGPRDWVRAGLEAALSASPAGVKPWRLDKALAGYETVMDGSHEAILRFSSEDEFLFFIDAISKGRIMSAIEPAGVGVEASALLIANNALANEARRVGPLTIEDMAAVFDRLSKTIFSEAALADKQWHLARIEEEIKAGRSQNAISYASFAIADAEATMRRNCQYLLDVLDGQGFEERDLSEEDEDAIKGIRAVLSSPVGVPRQHQTSTVSVPTRLLGEEVKIDPQSVKVNGSPASWDDASGWVSVEARAALDATEGTKG